MWLMQIIINQSNCQKIPIPVLLGEKLKGFIFRFLSKKNCSLVKSDSLVFQDRGK